MACVAAGPVVNSDERVRTKLFNFFCIGQINHVTKHFNAMWTALLYDFARITK